MAGRSNTTITAIATGPDTRRWHEQLIIIAGFNLLIMHLDMLAHPYGICGEL
jgi:hypothetical protein